MVVVKPMDCGCTDSLGWVYRVTRIERSVPSGVACIFCGYVAPQAVLAYRAGGSGAEPRRLKRIPPLSELEALDWEHRLDVRA